MHSLHTYTYRTDTTGFSCFYRFWYFTHPLDLPGIYGGFSLSTSFRFHWLRSLAQWTNWMHFSFYYIKPNQFVICSCWWLMLLLDYCFLRHFSLRILILWIALTWLICCSSATICMCICLCLCFIVWVCWGLFCMIWSFIAVRRAIEQ